MSKRKVYVASHYKGSGRIHNQDFRARSMKEATRKARDWARLRGRRILLVVLKSESV